MKTLKLLTMFSSVFNFSGPSSLKSRIQIVATEFAGRKNDSDGLAQIEYRTQPSSTPARHDKLLPNGKSLEMPCQNLQMIVRTFTN